MTWHLIAICAVSAIAVILIVVRRVWFCQKQDIEPDHKAKQARAENYSSLGNRCFINNEPEKAQGYYSKALQINEQLGDKEAIAKNYINLGIVLSKKEHPKQARIYWVKARDIFTEIDKTIEANGGGGIKEKRPGRNQKPGKWEEIKKLSYQ